jgi:hypothetical protein
MMSRKTQNKRGGKGCGWTVGWKIVFACVCVLACATAFFSSGRCLLFAMLHHIIIPMFADAAAALHFSAFTALLWCSFL